MSERPLPITELLRRVGDDKVFLQTPTAEGTFLAANKRRGYTALEFATYPELAEELMRGTVTKTLLVLVMDADVVQRAKADHLAGAPLPLTERERDLVASLGKTLAAAVELHGQGVGCPDCPPDHEDTGADCPMLVAAEAALAKIEGRS